jgi:hypothetical protein
MWETTCIKRCSTVFVMLVIYSQHQPGCPTVSILCCLGCPAASMCQYVLLTCI